MTTPMPDPSGAPVDDDLLRRAYALMVVTRALDTSAVTWQRQGLLPAYPPLRGQEAAQVGSVLGADLTSDLLFPTYRELGVAVAADVDLVGYFGNHLGHWNGGLYDPVASRLAPIQAVVGGSVLHAVGWALGRALDGENGVAVAYLGDGASSQGDVHEAMNFAAVLEAPVVFFVQNNRWALSVPLHRQVAGESVAARAGGYGIPGLVVDGDDVAAVYRAMRTAVEHARATRQPVVLEAMTYRRGPHATSDDPGRYRSLADEATAGADPIDRLRDRLTASGAADESWFADVDTDATGRIDALHAVLVASSPRPGADLFEHVFVHPTPQLTAQHARWREESDRV
ncbi:pyruvate dehydrogenase E1 component alpha subunit [Mycetocola sp. CAN_C7]|uniref:thiamine pyrophosphate-dependent enzyme n=1 Tax=Mycetocola sp. CAN_C7 TaxID=2787724 RepID=UPI0018CB34A2